MLRDLLGTFWRRGDQSSARVSLNAREVERPVQSRTSTHIATEVILPDALTVDVFRHVLMSLRGPVDCWTLVSDGLQRVGQKEVCFSVKIEPGEADTDYHPSLRAMYSTLYDLARQSRIVDVGGVSGLVEGFGLLGRADFTGIAYSIPQVFEGVRRPADALTALILTAAEFDVVRQFGLVRVAALLGHEYRYFPTAPWADRKRRPLTSPAGMADSVLSKVLRLAVGDAVAYLRRGGDDDHAVSARPGDSGNPLSLDGGEVVLAVTAGALATLRTGVSSLAAGQPIAVITSPDPAADSCLVWRPGTQGINAISAPGSTGGRMAGNHVVFLPAQSRNTVHILEDGFVVQLTSEAWSAFRQALEADAKSWTAPDAEQMTFRFQQLPAGVDAGPEYVFNNPVDGQAYVAESGWRRYGPTTRANDQTGCPTQTHGIRLLTEETRIAERTTSTAIAAFIRTVERLANQHLATTTTTFRLLIQFKCMPTSHEVKLAWQGDAPGDLLRALVQALEETDRLPVGEDDVSFQIEMLVSPASQNPTAGPTGAQ